MRPSARRGIMLTEIVVTLALLGVFLLIFLPLWRAVWRVQKEAPAATAAIFLTEAAATQLRADAWSAPSATVAADGALELGGTPTVRWSAAPGNDPDHPQISLTRRAGETERTFRLPAPTADAAPSFTAAPGRVTLALGGRTLTCPMPLREVSR